MRRARARRPLARIVCLVLLLVAAVPSVTQALYTMSLDNLRWEIEGWRPEDPPELAEKLPAWPDWRGFCPGLDNYFVNVGREFRRHCGPKLEEKKAALVECSDTFPGIEEWTPGSLLSQAGRCSAAGKGAVEVWGELAHCTLSSYITASDMTAQQRREWDTFLSGIADLQSLLELGEVFKEGKFAKLRDVETPTSLDEALELAELGKELQAEPGKRLETIEKVPQQVSGVRAALETLPFIGEEPPERLRNEAIDLLTSCRPEAARDARTMAELAHFERLQAARAAHVLAEEQFYCAAKANRFETMTELEQRSVLPAFARDGRLRLEGVRQPYRMTLNDLKYARIEHRSAIRAYRELLADPELADERFAHWEERRERFAAETAELVEHAGLCARSCGSAEAGCRFPLETVESTLRAKAADPCAAARGVESRLLSLAEHVDRARMARNNYDLAFDRHEPKIRSLLTECKVNEAMFESVELQRTIRDYERQGTRVAACSDDRLSELEQAITSRRSELIAQLDEAEGLLARGRAASEACRWDEAETAVSAAYDAAAGTGCAPETPSLAELYGRIDSLLQDVTARRSRDEAQRGRVEQRVLELRAQAWADLELARSDDAGRCEAVERVRAAADELAGLKGGGLCPAAGGDHAAEADDLRQSADEAASRHRDALESLLTTARQAEEACDLEDVEWAAGEIESLPPLCGADRGALVSELRSRHRRLADGRRSARDHLLGELRRLEGALDLGRATEADAVVADVRTFAPEGVPGTCYDDLVSEILARAGAPSGGSVEEGTGQSGSGDAGGVGSGDAGAGGWVIETGDGEGTVADPAPASPPPVAPPAPTVVDPAAGLIRSAEVAFAGCDFVSAKTLAERVRRIDPGHPWLEANAARIDEYAEKQRITANHLTIARDLVQKGRLKDARDAMVAAARDAPGCMTEPVAVVADAVQSSIQKRKQANRTAIANGLGGLLSAIGQVAAVVAADEGGGVVAGGGGSSRGSGGASVGGAGGGSGASCYYVPNRHHDFASFEASESPPVWVVQVARSPSGPTIYNVLPIDAEETSQILAHLRRTTGADYLGPYGSKAAAERVARQRCPTTF